MGKSWEPLTRSGLSCVALWPGGDIRGSEPGAVKSSILLDVCLQSSPELEMEIGKLLANRWHIKID